MRRGNLPRCSSGEANRTRKFDFTTLGASTAEDVIAAKRGRYGGWRVLESL